MVSFCTTSKPSCPFPGGVSTGLLLFFLALVPLSAVVTASLDPAPFRGPVYPGVVSGPGPSLDRSGAVWGPLPGAEGGKIEFVSFRYPESFGVCRGQLKPEAHRRLTAEITPHSPPRSRSVRFLEVRLQEHSTDKFPGSYPYQLRRLDIHPDALVATEDDPHLRPRPRHAASSHARSITRLSDRSTETIEDYLFAYRNHNPRILSDDAWISETILMPNVTDKETVLSLARIAADAYTEVEGTGDWIDVGAPYNLTDNFGWAGDGLRGHIFSDDGNKTIIIGLKGTSAAVFDGPDTTTNDKVNDNLLFSCCCARVSYWWKTVCDCYCGTAFTCNSICLKDALLDENRYYRAALNLYTNVTNMYPDANIWLVGHSLGGAISSLLGQTYGLPVVAFESPGEALAAQRIGLPKPPGNNPKGAEGMAVFHFGNTADPIFMGSCNGPTSGCSIAGYAFETRCHSGFECVYDVVSDRGWRVGLGYHKILRVIKDVIEEYDTVPQCISDECVDCFEWKFVEGNTTTTTTRTTSVPTTTSTSTCKTRGWWGCLDQQTTTTVTSTSIGTRTEPSTTCTHYGWFGNCLDPTSSTTTSTLKATTRPTITTIITKTVTTSASVPSETCSRHGWFGGCLDPSPTNTAATTTTASATPETKPGNTKCGRFFFFRHCSKPTPNGGEPVATKQACKKPGLVWGCWDRALGGEL